MIVEQIRFLRKESIGTVSVVNDSEGKNYFFLEPYYYKLQEGKYILKQYFSPRMKKEVLRIMNDDRAFNLRFFEIHIGNKKEESNGCNLIGLELRVNRSNIGVWNSGIAFGEVYNKWSGATLIIKNNWCVNE